MTEHKHPAVDGVEDYANEGKVYYKSAAVSQRMIGIGSVLMGLGVWAIFFALLFLFGCAPETSRCLDLSDHQINQAYQQVQQCSGIVAPMPPISYTMDNSVTISAVTSLLPEGQSRIIFNVGYLSQLECPSEASVYKHEFVHSLLHYAGFPIQDNKDHQSPLFGLCS